MGGTASKVLVTKTTKGGLIYSTNVLPEFGLSGSPLLLMTDDPYNWYKCNTYKIFNANEQLVTK